ncbi:hypothetical protein MRB53_030291 [Persea americana]|uniref:Uncharacterized protein n=1 Tax=Persea americana TaxID=3435 RepID=A0ACC2KKX5_PERAE|nr:hypothetical protein MRB53_030291 [Persea americana]
MLHSTNLNGGPLLLIVAERVIRNRGDLAFVEEEDPDMSSLVRLRQNQMRKVAPSPSPLRHCHRRRRHKNREGHGLYRTLL